MKKRALVTGGTRGIGKAIADRVSQLGYETWITGTSKTETTRTGIARYLPCDFTNSESVTDLAALIAQENIAVLINNAGINRLGPLENYANRDFEDLFKVNVLAPFQLSKAVLPDMIRQKYGRIVNVSSVFSLVSRSGRSAYSMTKTGLLGMTRALALEVAKKGITVNCIAPGFIETDLVRDSLGPQGIEELKTRIPLGRLGQAPEIAHAVEFLISPENTYMTGQNLVVDGGFTVE